MKIWLDIVLDAAIGVISAIALTHCQSAQSSTAGMPGTECQNEELELERRGHWLAECSDTLLEEGLLEEVDNK